MIIIIPVITTPNGSISNGIKEFVAPFEELFKQGKLGGIDYTGIQVTSTHGYLLWYTSSSAGDGNESI